MRCRHCGTELQHVFADLATAPPSNAYLNAADLAAPERYYPLRVLVCSECWLVQTEDYTGAKDLFSDDYAYFSSFSDSWLAHCEVFVARMVERFGLDASTLVAEIAANDGYLLQYVKTRGIPCYGIEPTAGTAAAARSKGIEIVQAFFGEVLAHTLVAGGKQADLVVANNVLAHVPNINDFVRGFACLMKPDGLGTLEFPHLYRLVEMNQFDTIYHEHYSYLSLGTVRRIFERNGLLVFDVEEVDTHGGSLRVFVQRRDTGQRPVADKVSALCEMEQRAGMESLEYYRDFQGRADRVKDDFLTYLIDAKRRGVRVGAYGAAAKGNTLLNYAGVHADLLPYVADANPNKQGKFLPGSRIPIVDEPHLQAHRPDEVIVLPWNIVDEVVAKLGYIRAWGGCFVAAVPKMTRL